MMGENCCVYCGDWFQCRDHVIPVSYNSVKRNYKKGDTVKCCNLCNSLLGNSSYHSIESRATFVVGRYKNKFKNILEFDEWESEEIHKLGYNLREGVLSKTYLKTKDLSCM